MKKFMFDTHVFEDDLLEEEETIEEEVEDIPVVPVFTEEEIEAARKEGFAAGKEEGLKEATAARAQTLANTMNILAQKFPDLVSSENARAESYEIEAVKLASGIFEKLFPLYNEQHGFQELEHAIREILSKQLGQKKITVQVASGAVEGIEKLCSQLAQKGGFGDIFTIQGIEELNEGTARMIWADGGAVRDAQALSEEIRVILEQALAGKGGSVHDDIEESSSVKDLPPADEQPQPEPEIEEKAEAGIKTQAEPEDQEGEAP